MPRSEASPRLFSSPLFLALTAILLVAAGCAQEKACGGCVVLMGDSITSLWPEMQTGSEVAWMKVVNQGVPSETTTQMAARFERDVIRRRARAVVIQGGVNDLLVAPPVVTESNLERMAERAEQMQVRVVLATLTPLGFPNDERGASARHTEQDEGRKKVRELNAWIKSFAARKRYAVVDYYSALADERGCYQPGLTADGVHPSAAGYERMERALLEAVQYAARNGE
jgi:lysophospholipase L1-like esterase